MADSFVPSNAHKFIPSKPDSGLAAIHKEQSPPGAKWYDGTIPNPIKNPGKRKAPTVADDAPPPYEPVAKKAREETKELPLSEGLRDRFRRLDKRLGLFSDRLSFLESHCDAYTVKKKRERNAKLGIPTGLRYSDSESD